MVNVYNSVHIYGAIVQLHFHNGDEDQEAIESLIDHMEGIAFDHEEDGVILFKLVGLDYVNIFNYGDYLNGHTEINND